MVTLRRQLLPSLSTVCVLLLGIILTSYNPSHAIVDDILDTVLIPDLGDLTDVSDLGGLLNTTLVPDLGDVFSVPSFDGVGAAAPNFIIAFALVAIAAIGGIIAAGVLAIAN